MNEEKKVYQLILTPCESLLLVNTVKVMREMTTTLFTMATSGMDVDYEPFQGILGAEELFKKVDDLEMLLLDNNWGN